MKKQILITILGLSLVACGPKDKDVNQASKPVEKIEDQDDDQANKSEEKVVEKEENKPEGSLENAKENQETEALGEDDYFFSYYDLVSIKDGQVIDALKDLGLNTKDLSHEKEYSVNYIPYSNDLFVLGSYPKHDFSIRKIAGKDLTTLYQFKKNEAFLPKAMIGDKIYGMYSYYDGDDYNYQINDEKSGFAQIDLASGKINLYTGIRSAGGESIIGLGVTDKEAVFSKLEKDASVNLYKIDLEKAFDQEPDLIEKDTQVQYVMGAKYLDKDKPVYEIFKSEGDDFIIKDEKYTLTDTATLNFIGKYMIIQNPGESAYLFNMDIINYLTGETIEKDLESYGYRAHDGKLYYIDHDKNIKSLDLNK
ncbi:hypothetical protein [uncultured Anaerococcus sp.]|uniref:hypothetical protein n=1 Tax=uncultured Anaerococcus sp. TaxID=293428 RepID=UPI0026018E16|nr:hypothetical protein [uncultured Anaerococcus sp.]